MGARSGVALQGDADPYVGADVRLSFPRSPLTINATFDYFFDEEATLYQLSFNALYYISLPLQHVDPYVGIGVDLSSFSFMQNTPGVDNTGNRVGMNLVAGVCFDLPLVSPFVHVVKELGEFDPVLFGAGLTIAVDGDRRWTRCGRRAR